MRIRQVLLFYLLFQASASCAVTHTSCATLTGDFLSISGSHDSVLVAAGTDGLMRRSTDFGLNWQYVFTNTLDNIKKTCVLPSGECMILTSSGKIQVSSLDISHWADFSPDSVDAVRDIACAGNTIVVLTDKNLLLLSDDEGKTWKSLAKSVFPELAVKLSMLDSENVLIYTDKLRFYKLNFPTGQVKQIVQSGAVSNILSAFSVSLLASDAHTLAISAGSFVIRTDLLDTNWILDSMNTSANALIVKYDRVVWTCDTVMYIAKGETKRGIACNPTAISPWFKTDDNTIINGISMLRDSSIVLVGSNFTILKYRSPDFKVVAFCNQNQALRPSFNSTGLGVLPTTGHTYWTSNNGATWNPEHKYAVYGTKSVVVQQVEVDNTNTIYASTNKNFTILRSDDGGLSYDSLFNLLSGIPLSLITHAGDLLLNAYSTQIPQWQTLVTSSSDAGKSWTQVLSLDSCNVSVYCHEREKVWFATNPQPISVYDSSTGISGKMYPDCKIVYTDNGFKTSRIYRCPVGTKRVLSIDIGRADTLLLACLGEDFKQVQYFKCTDGGQTWQLYNSVSTAIAPLAYDVAFTKSTKIAVCSRFDGLFRSLDGMSTWKKCDLPDSISFERVVAMSNDFVLAYGRNNRTGRFIKLVIDMASDITTSVEHEQFSTWLKRSDLSIVFPNPCSEWATCKVVWNSSALDRSILNIAIYNQFGNTCRVVPELESDNPTTSTYRFDMSDTPKGCYLIAVSFPNYTLTRQFIHN